MPAEGRDPHRSQGDRHRSCQAASPSTTCSDGGVPSCRWNGEGGPRIRAEGRARGTSTGPASPHPPPLRGAAISRKWEKEPASRNLLGRHRDERDRRRCAAQATRGVQSRGRTRFRMVDVGVRRPDARRRHPGPGDPRRGASSRWSRGPWLGLPHLRVPKFLTTCRPGTRSTTTTMVPLAADLRHAGDLHHRHGSSPMPGRASASRSFSPNSARIGLRRAGGHRNRAPGRHPQHHLRHLGPLRLRALRAAPTSSRWLIGRCSGPSRCCRRAVRRAALRHRHLHRRHHPRHHGPALRHLGVARRLRDRAAGAEGSGLRGRLRPPGRS